MERADMIGETIGNYRVLAQIGQGGMGTVYLAEDTQLGRKVAIKVLNPSLIERGGSELQRFQNEARIQANLNHPNVVTLLAFEPCRDSYCMIMEYVEGRTLAELVRGIGAFPSHIVVNIAKQVLDGLSAAHRQQVVHRDLKASNVMITPEGTAKVMDFGIAKAQGGQNLTASGAQVGTVLYMSPEQIKGEPVDARSDIYSFGIIMFELLTGRVPFKDESDFSIMVHHVKTPPTPPTQLLPDIPAPLEQIVLRSLQKNPQERFQSAGEILACLEAFENAERAAGRGEWYARRTLSAWLSAPSAHVPPAAAMPLPPAGPAVAAKPASRMTLVLVLAGLALVLGGVTYAYWKMNRRAGSAPAAEEGSAASGHAAARKAGLPDQILPATAATAVGQEALSIRPADPIPSTAAGGTAAPGNIAGREPAGARRQKAAEPATGAAAVPAGAKAGQTGQAVSGNAPENPPAKAGAAKDAGLPRADGFLLYVDADPEGEKLPLPLAQARLAELLRDAGKSVLSATTAANLRTAVDRDDFTELLRSGAGYVIIETTHASVETQNAYGSTYYVARITVTLELTRASDGKVAATAGSEVRSRGSADLQAALKEALLNATSEAARDLLRKIQS